MNLAHAGAEMGVLVAPSLLIEPIPLFDEDVMNCAYGGALDYRFNASECQSIFESSAILRSWHQKDSQLPADGTFLAKAKARTGALGRAGCSASGAELKARIEKRRMLLFSCCETTSVSACAPGGRSRLTR